MKTFFMLLVLCPYLGLAQKQKQYTVGDTVTTELMKQLYGNSTAYKQLTLINLTTLQCKNSRSYLPGFTELAKRFTNEMQLVHVNNKALDEQFNYVLTPHIVWVNGEGKIVAITGGEYVDEQNIQQVLKGSTPNWPVKRDDRYFDYEKPLINAYDNTNETQKKENAKDDAVQFYSVLTPMKPGAMSKYLVQRDSVTHTTRMAMYNKSIVALYLMGIGKSNVFPKSHVLLQVKEKDKWVQPNDTYTAEWNEYNTYCYETVVHRLYTAAEMRKGLLHDLDRAFGVTSFYGTKLVDCYQLVLTDEAVKMKSKGGAFKNTLYTSDSIKILQNGKVADLLWELNNTWLNVPVVDVTGYNGGVDMILQLDDFTQNKKLEMQLAKYGLALVPAKMRLEVLEIKDNNNHKP